MSLPARTGWDAEGLGRTLAPLLPGLAVEVQPELDSTNTALLARASAGDATPCLLVAERQTAGRGRRGRQWWAAPGDTLTVSLGLALTPADGVPWGGLALAVGLALAEALDPDHAGLDLKWPNDLWWHATPDAPGHKAGGILIETQPLADGLVLPGGAAAPAGARWVVIGIGLNVRPAAAEAAAGFRTPPACVQDWWPGADAGAVLHRLAPPLLHAVLDWQARGLAPLLLRLAQRDRLRGRSLQAGTLTGTGCGMAEDGALLLRDTAGTVHPVHSGEVSVRPC